MEKIAPKIANVDAKIAAKIANVDGPYSTSCFINVCFFFRPVVETTDELELVTGKLYSLEVVMIFNSHSPEFSLGFEHLDSKFVQNPIGKEHLEWKSKSMSQ